MATTSGKEIVRYRKPKKRPARRDSVKRTDAIKRWAFPIVLIVAAIITWYVLFGTGMASGAFGAANYPLTLTIIVTVFHAVILAWPTFLLVKKKAWWRLVVVGIMLLGMLLALVTTYILVAGAPLWGIKIPGVAALLLSVIAAYSLSRYAEEDQNLVEDVELLPARNKSIRKQQEKVDKAAARASHAEGIAKALGKESSDITHAAEIASKDRTAKQKAYDNSPAVKAVGTIEKEIATKKTEVGDLTTEKTALARSFGRPKNASSKDELSYEDKQKRRKEIDARIKEIEETEIPQLEAKLADAQRDAEATSEKRALDAASNLSVKKSEEEAEKRDEYKTAKEEAGIRTRQWKEEQAVLDSMTGQRDEVTSRQQNAEETRRLLWRDDLLVPGLCALFAILFYPAWYGWVLLEVF